MNKPNFLRAILFVLCGLLLTHAANAVDKPGHPVRVYTLKEIALDRQYRLLGSVEARTQIDIINRVSGQIMELPWNEGDTINQGDLLVHIDDREMTAEHDKAEANLRQARIDLDRLKKLQPRNLASEDEVSRASTLMELARAEERLLRTRLNDTRITSPVDGVISNIEIRQGAYAPENSKILSLYSPDSLYIQAYLPELLVSDATSAKWHIRIPRLGENAARIASIQRLHPVSDPGTRQVTIELGLADVSNLLPGMQADILMQTEPSSRLWLPLVAVQEDERGRFVYINAGGKAARVPIMTGEIRADHVEITGGLSIGDQVVVTGFNGLSQGRALQVRQ